MLSSLCEARPAALAYDTGPLAPAGPLCWAGPPWPSPNLPLGPLAPCCRPGHPWLGPAFLDLLPWWEPCCCCLPARGPVTSWRGDGLLLTVSGSWLSPGFLLFPLESEDMMVGSTPSPPVAGREGWVALVESSADAWLQQAPETLRLCRPTAYSRELIESCHNQAFLTPCPPLPYIF